MVGVKAKKSPTRSNSFSPFFIFPARFQYFENFFLGPASTILYFISSMTHDGFLLYL